MNQLRKRQRILASSLAVLASSVLVTPLLSAGRLHAAPPKLTAPGGRPSGIGGPCPPGHPGYTWTFRETSGISVLEEAVVVPAGHTPLTWKGTKAAAISGGGAVGGFFGKFAARMMSLYITTSTGDIWVRFAKVTKTRVVTIRCDKGKWVIKNISPVTQTIAKGSWVKLPLGGFPAATVTPADVRKAITRVTPKATPVTNLDTFTSP